MSFMESDRVRVLLERAGLGGLSPRAVRAALILGVLVVGFGLWRFWPRAAAPEVRFDSGREEATDGVPEASVEGSLGAPSGPIVHVAGAVMRPGVYGLAPGSRVVDAIAAAGGALGSAAPDSLNLARIVCDGEQVYVPTTDEAAGAAAPLQMAPGSAGPSTGTLVNINTATATQLEELPGVGPATAQKIVDDREANGPFARPEDLMRVPGIGQKKYEAMAEMVTCR